MTGTDSPSVKKILVPIDGSPVSKKAAQFAVHIARLEKAKVTVMHVLEGVKQGGAIGLQAKYGNVRLVEGFNKVRTQSAEKWVAEVQELARSHGVDVKSEIVPDSGASEEGRVSAVSYPLASILARSRSMPGWNLLFAYHTATALPPIIAAIVIASPIMSFITGTFDINFDFMII